MPRTASAASVPRAKAFDCSTRVPCPRPGRCGLQPGQSARNVPVNLTIVREGTGQFFATRGGDKCALDTVAQVPLEDDPSRFRLEGRGYCTQPARALDGNGAVLMSRFDVVAIVAAPPDEPAATPPVAEHAQ
jgi:hypothetical protein